MWCVRVLALSRYRLGLARVHMRAEVFWNQWRVEAFREFWALLADTEEEFELDTLFYSGDQCQVLQVVLEVLHPILNLSSARSQLAWTHVLKVSLCKLIGAVWKLERRVLVDQAFVQAAERFVLLIDGPLLSIELDFDHILSVSSMVIIVFNHSGLNYSERKRDLEEDWAAATAVLCARLHMVNEALRGEEHVAELALHRYRMLEHSLEDLNIVHLLSQLLVSVFHLGNCLWQTLICLHQFIGMAWFWLQLWLLQLVLLLILDGLHQCFLHFQHLFLLLLLSLLHLLTHFLLFIFPELSLGVLNLLLLQVFDLVFELHFELFKFKTLVGIKLQL